jgi:hypothetical protein
MRDNMLQQLSTSRLTTYRLSRRIMHALTAVLMSEIQKECVCSTDEKIQDFGQIAMTGVKESSPFDKALTELESANARPFKASKAGLCFPLGLFPSLFSFTELEEQ